MTDLQASLWRDFHGAALWAGVTGFIWAAFGAVPVQIAVARKLGLSAAQASSWLFVIMLTAAIVTIAVSLRYRQPIPVGWTIPGAVYLGSLAGQFTFPEMVAANLFAGVLILVLGLLGIGARIMVWLPLPIIMGMFAGSILGYVSDLVEVAVSDVLIGGSVISGYLLGRLSANWRIPPVGVAVIFGAVTIILTQQTSPASVAWEPPALVLAEMSFSPRALIAISLPMVLLAMGIGNVQGLGFLMAQGYRVPANAITVLTGINSILNAFLGGHPASVARASAAIVGSSEAGPAPTRYWANLIFGGLVILIAVAASTVTSLVAVLPASYIIAVAGLAILSALQDAFERAFGSRLRFGALVAFIVAATPFALGGIPSDFWAIVVGVGASLAVERRELFDYWRSG